MPFIDAFPEPTVNTTTTGRRLSWAIDVVPGDAAYRYTHWLPRLKVGGTEVEVRSAGLEDTETGVGPVLTVSLLDITQAPLFTPTAVIDFGIGRRVAGVWEESTFRSLFADGRVEEIRSGKEGPPFSPNDTVTVRISSKGADRLNRTSEKGLIVYDPSKETIDADSLETIYDTHGNSFKPEVKAIANLTLGRLLNEVLVTRCGFATVKTDLPKNDYPLTRYQVRMGERFFDGLKPFIGMFFPIISTNGDTVFIADATKERPAGFPTGFNLTVDDVSGIDESYTQQRLDAILVRSTSLQNNYDFTTFKFEYPKSNNGNTRTETEKISIEYRKLTPGGGNRVVDTKLNIETKKTYVGGTQVDENVTAFEFDEFGRQSHKRTTVSKRLPPYSDVNNPPVLQTVGEENERVLYQAHPFKQNSSYVARRDMRREGYYTRDSENQRPDGTDFLQEAALAHRAGNIQVGQAFEFGALRSRSETAYPLASGNVSVSVLETDELTGLVLENYTEERPGDIAETNGHTTEITTVVFNNDTGTRSFDRIDEINVGELPAKHFEPLAKRILRYKQNSSKSGQFSFIGYVDLLKKGATFTAFDRDANELGDFVITGLSFVFAATGVTVRISSRQVTTSASNDVTDIGGWASGLQSGGFVEYTFTHTPVSGETISLGDTAPAGIAAIEVKEISGAYHNLMSGGPFSLTPYAGVSTTFKIKITAAAVTELTEGFVVIDIV